MRRKSRIPATQWPPRLPTRLGWKNTASNPTSALRARYSRATIRVRAILSLSCFAFILSQTSFKSDFTSWVRTARAILIPRLAHGLRCNGRPCSSHLRVRPFIDRLGEIRRIGSFRCGARSSSWSAVSMDEAGMPQVGSAIGAARPSARQPAPPAVTSPWCIASRRQLRCQ